jgi:Tfp pilus assembly protein PilZ
MESSVKTLSRGVGRQTESVGLSVGTQCMLHVTGRHFLVRVVDVDNDLVRLTFPGKDYPIEGMRGEIQLHDEEGFFYYPVVVVEGPMLKGSGIRVRKMGGLKRSRHREACRVSTDLTVQVKDEAHVRLYNGLLLNVSAGGAFIQTDAPFDYSTTVEITISLPGEPTHGIRSRIVDVLPACETARSTDKRFCVRFLDIDPDAEKSITRYVWERLHQMYPTQ